MPLQIRRGTDAERSAMTQPLAAGELIYVTDTQRLFVGNGATVGGVGNYRLYRQRCAGCCCNSAYK